MEQLKIEDIKRAIKITANITSMDIDDDIVDFTLKKLRGRLTGPEVIAALDDLVELGKKPTIANILDYEKGGYDSAEIAYAKAVANLSGEDRTGLTNNCIMQAWSIAGPLYSESMNFDASRAFKSEYERLVLENKQQGLKKPNWFLTLGTDKQQRDDFIRDTASNGLISIEQARVYLPQLTAEEITDPSRMIHGPTFAGLLQNIMDQDDEVVHLSDKEQIKSNIAAMRATIRSKGEE